MYKDYLIRCKKNEVKLGYPYLYKSTVPPWILNFPTKDHWRSMTKLSDIIKGLYFLQIHYKEWGIDSLAFPPLGCGQGQLEWRIVGPTLYRFLNKFEIPIEIYAPYGTPHEEIQPKFLSQNEYLISKGIEMPSPKWINPSWIALVEILKRIEEQPYHWPIGRTIFQKIAYVATEEGLPTGIKYQRSSFGPFAKDLKKEITRLLNNGLIIEERIGNMFAVKVGPTFNDAKKAYLSDILIWESIIEKIVDLFIRINSTIWAEMVATVIFTYKSLLKEKNSQPYENEIVNEIMKWKQKRNPPLDKEKIALTVRNLAILNWINPKASKDLPLPKQAVYD